ncbi:MAG: ATP-grasp domain-containing protein, partial [Brachymonas sp.]|nr:ATP-grasp domain-containing protein [Brachymonas sp.]
SLDGIAFNGEIKPLGIVDSVMYPGTQAFMRFEYPSRLPNLAQQQALDVAKRFLQSVGFTHGLFNMEFFYCQATQTLKVIEFNPRMASQFADLYQRVDGLNLHAMAIELAHGRDPWALSRTASTANCASSFVYRVFDERAAHLPQRIPPMPSAAQLQQLQAQFPDHLLLQFPKAGHSLARDFKWLGSYRYGIVHLGGRDAQDLQERCQRISGILGWLAPYSDGLQEELSVPSPLTSALPLRF